MDGPTQNDGSSLQYSTVQYSTVVSLGPGLAWRREEMDFKLNVDPISCCQAAVLATLPVSCSHSPPADRGAGGGWRGRGCGDWTELLIHVSVLVCLHLGQSKHSVLAFPDNKMVILQIDNCEAQARVRQGKARKGKERQGWRKVKGLKAYYRFVYSRQVKYIIIYK